MSSTFHPPSPTPPIPPCVAIRELIEQHKRRSIDGETFVLVEPLTRALEARFSDLDKTLWHVVHEAHKDFSAEPPDIHLDNLPYMRRILYSLLDLEKPELLPLFRQFKDDHLPIREDKLLTILDAQRLEEYSCDVQFPALWLGNQRAWCPFVFELGPQVDVEVDSQCIVPFYLKRALKPYEDGQEPHDTRAKLYEVHIPAELINSSSLLEPPPLLHYEDTPGPQKRTYYRFALKEFPESLKQSYEKEVRTFRALGAQSGMIPYYGCYDFVTRLGRHSFGILLEFADFDLNGAISEEEPPVTPDEIRSFYESMQELAATLANIHRLDINGTKYDLWHGDIKPENILRVGDHFKLADPGDAWIQRAPEDGKPKAKAEVYGGTRTYASPEKARWLENIGDKLPDQILQNSDVWSLGCVFSIAATYVVLGEQGVMIYAGIRKHAYAALNLGLPQDVFHANELVLDVVTAWHLYLRLVARRGDVLTAAVLDMIDDRMLMPTEHRWEAKQVADHFGSLLSSSNAKDIEVPEVIEKILRELDLKAEINQESQNQINRLDSDIAKRRFRQVEETEARTITRPRFKSEARLQAGKIKPTAQRSVHRADLLKKINQSPDHPPIPAFPQSSSRSHSTGMGSGILPTALIPGRSSAPEIFTIHRMKEQLEALERDRSLGPLKAFIDLKARRRSVRREIGEDSDLLLPHYKDRDIIILVDNGSSMESHWAEVKFVLEVLIWRVLGYDSDGIELFFTDPKSSHLSIGPSKKQSVEQFLDAIRNSRPTMSSARTELRPGLNKIMSSYHTAGKPRTVFILTDGVWEGLPYESNIEDWVTHSVCELARQDPKTLQSPSRESAGSFWQWDFEELRPITFQFIAFGHDTIGKRRMKRLDDLMAERGLPDLIDMEPSSGDAYKMLLGSLTPKWDEKENPVNKLRDLSPPPSIYATSPTTSVTHSLEMGAQTPRTSTISSPQTFNVDTYRSNRTSTLSLANPYVGAQAFEAGESSRQGRTLAPQTDERATSVSRSPSGRSERRRSWLSIRMARP